MKSGIVKIQKTENSKTHGASTFLEKNEFIFLHLFLKCALLYQHWFGYTVLILLGFISYKCLYETL